MVYSCYELYSSFFFFKFTFPLVWKRNQENIREKRNCLVILTNHFLNYCKLGISSGQVNQKTTQYTWQNPASCKEKLGNPEEWGLAACLQVLGAVGWALPVSSALLCPASLVSETHQTVWGTVSFSPCPDYKIRPTTDTNALCSPHSFWVFQLKGDGE